MKKKNWQAPFDEKGVLLDYAEDHRTIVWHDPEEKYVLKLKFAYFSRGRSSAKADYKDEKGQVWSMFLTDLSDLILTGARVNELHGTFVVVKRGANYGVKFESAQIGDRNGSLCKHFRRNRAQRGNGRCPGKSRDERNA